MKEYNDRSYLHLYALFLTVSLLVVASSISVPISSSEIRCMVVFTPSEDATIKIDIQFNEFGAKDPQNEYYVVWVNNTETDSMDFTRVKDGSEFRRQMQLDPNVVYKVCFTIHTMDREVPMINAEYEAYHQFQIQNNNRNTIKLPDSILKQNDLKTSYDDALVMLEMTERQLNQTKQHKDKDDKKYKDIERLESRLEFISIAEIAVILVIGTVQFIVIKRKLEDGVRI